ncbi:N-acetyllactosaminide beta-1,3-N-acetylglucosaminyltransferase 3-like [Protopterus annectens]|uniref:N-acetyllactosaminide beta-1,3-N-acetylglucosaminyltransferase 3-like n=1 Tax=Protopterus annectens TaxID=7888 RepID=UPI001CFC3137|nr:N-acetyllactosaminide beta-1,3-N-acetylglucosaminyltransferase 3-like [Protopterus annectens]
MVHVDIQPLYRYIWIFKKRCLTYFVLIVSGISAIFFFNRDCYNSLQNTTKKWVSVIKTEIETTTPHLLHQKVIHDCKENTSVANINGFSELADHIKDFLRYKHCRSFEMIYDIPNKCDGPQQSDKVFLFLMIKSSPNHYERREVIRKTWGQERIYSGMQIRRLFILGVSSNENERKKLKQLIRTEYQQYGDIIQWNFYDTFFNLTLKQVLFYEWFIEHCPYVKFLFNGDDDSYVNSEEMVHYFLDLKGNDGSKHLFVGILMDHVSPIRSTESKYCVPEQVYPSDSYPPYCSGGGIMMSGFTAREIYHASLSIPIMPIDDVYQGMCLEKAGLSPASHMAIFTIGLESRFISLDSLDLCFYKKFLVVHRVQPYEIAMLWEAIHASDQQCGDSAL